MALSFCIFLFQAFADERHRQEMLRTYSTVSDIKEMQVTRIIFRLCMIEKTRVGKKIAIF